MMNSVVAIDGPSASGKSTVARKAAAELEFLFVDSGAMYRGLTWKALRDGVDTGDVAAIAALVPVTEYDFYVKDGAVKFRLDGIDLDAELRTEEINRNVSKVASVADVRKRVVDGLRSMLELGSLVIEGRDIATVVFPDARYKYYLDASPEERARRRHGEMAEKDSLLQSQVLESIKERDRIDQTRDVDPLRVADDSEVIDTTGMTIDEVVAVVKSKVTG